MTTFSHFIHDIAYIKALLEQGIGWPVQVITDKHQQIGSEAPPSEWMTSIYDFSNLHPYPQIKFSPANEAFIFVSDLKTKMDPITYVMGPCLNKPSIPLEAETTSSCLNQILHQAALVHLLINQQRLTVEDILKENFYNEAMISQLEDKLRQDFTFIRIDDHVQTHIPGDIQYENQILACVSHGRVKELLPILDRINRFPLLSDHLKETPLQTMKTMVASMIIVASKTARESGLPIAISYKINTFYLQEINKTTDLTTLNQLKISALIDLTHRVHALRRTKNSQTVKEVTFYIRKNLYQNPSVHDVCQALHFNPSYLARLFKKEMNMTISEYMMQEKIKEAKQLLAMTNHSILEICSLLHFTDQSHFTKNFKKFTGQTPKQYRQHYKVLN